MFYNSYNPWEKPRFFLNIGYDIVLDKSNLLVNCGATQHVITDKSKFINFDQNFELGNHFVEFSWREPSE